MERHSPSIPQTGALKLSICITTFNRAAFIGATLESILSQTTNDCEVVILDSASTDDTERVLTQYVQRFNRLRYFRQGVNNGFDRDCNGVVELAAGEYCWLMTDDDLLRPGAVAAVLGALREDLGFIFVNVEGRDFSMSKVVEARCIDIQSNRAYGSFEADRLFADIGGMLTYVGGFVIKRSIWLSREKEIFYDSMFVHVGVVFQEPLPGGSLVIAEPYISYRMGNVHTWSSRTFETFMIKWPSLVWSLPISDSAKSRVCSAAPWKDFRQLFRYRGRGCYSSTEYRRYVRPRLRSVREMLGPTIVALLPGVLVNALCLLYVSLVNCPRRGIRLQFLRESRYYVGNWRVLSVSRKVGREL